MKTIRSKIFSVYVLVLLALVITIVSAYVATDTQRQHLIITELLSKQKLLIERVMFSTINSAESGLVNEERFFEKLEENTASINGYENDVDFMLNAFTILEYPLDGKIVKLKFGGEFLEVFSNAVERSKGNWSEAKEEVRWLLNPDNLDDKALYTDHLNTFRNLKTELIINSDYLTKICREEADRKKVLSESVQTLATAIAILIFLWLVYFMNRDFRQPLEQVSRVFKKMGKGDFNQKLERTQEDEFKELFDDFNVFIDSLTAIREIENRILVEDQVNVILKFIRESFAEFVQIDEIKIVYENGAKQIMEVFDGVNGTGEKEVEIMDQYDEMTFIGTNNIVVPININDVYLGYALMTSFKGFDHNATLFIESLSDKISFAFYKSLLFKDLLTIVTDGLADLTESRDPETRRHLVRMSSYAQIIARQLQIDRHFADEIDDEFINNIKVTAPMHDIGKVSVPDAVLLKPGKLTDEEFDIMKMHAGAGAIVLRKIHERFEKYNLSYFFMAAEIANFHQEKYNGTGYPTGISGERIPIAARISTLADVFDALTSKRPYKNAFSLEKSYNIIRESAGGHFDPLVVDAFFKAQEDIESVYEKYKEV